MSSINLRKGIFMRRKDNKTTTDFKMDEYRERLIEERKITELVKTYSQKKIIKNANTKIFWNKKIEAGDDFRKLDPMSKDRIIQVVRMIRGKKGKILDLGFGYGYFEQKIKEKKSNFELYGTDISSYAVERARKKYSKNFFVGSISKLSFNDNLFDYVISLECLEHIESNKIFKTLGEIKRVLKIKGKAIFSVPINEKYTKDFNPNNHLRRYSEKLFIQELIIAGFKAEKVMKLYAFSNYYLLRKVLSKLLPYRWKPNILIVKCSIG